MNNADEWPQRLYGIPGLVPRIAVERPHERPSRVVLRYGGEGLPRVGGDEANAPRISVLLSAGGVSAAELYLGHLDAPEHDDIATWDQAVADTSVVEVDGAQYPCAGFRAADARCLETFLPGAYVGLVLIGISEMELRLTISLPWEDMLDAAPHQLRRVLSDFHRA